MDIEIREVTSAALKRYEDISIAFESDTVYRVEQADSGLGGLRLVEEKLAETFVKDYDTNEGQSPARWAERFDMSKWGILLACEGALEIGGAIVAFDTPGVDMLEGRRDLSVLWDLRVRPEARGMGVGTLLFEYAEDWSRQRGCVQMKIETQNINVNACKFYSSHGCHLGCIDRYSYKDDPAIGDETMLLWYKELAR